MNILPWLHILAAYFLYILVTLLTSLLIRRLAGDLKDMAARNSPRVLLLGAAANLLAMLGVILLLVFWDRRPVAALGLGFSRLDLLAALAGVGLTYALAVGFLFVQRLTGRVIALGAASPLASGAGAGSMALGLLVLAAVVLQEETLNRGYVTLQLLHLGPALILLVTTLTFVLIHFLTNRAGPAQVISWVISGLVLGLAYLLSGSIWLPILLHYATDTANVLVFNITGQFSFFQTTPALTDVQRATFRVLYGLVVVVLLLAVYGLNFKIV